jgi:hypothetical protein
MNPREEARDLIINPLPTDVEVYSACPTTLVLETIYFLSEAIEQEELHLAYLKNEREKLKSRAISENIKDSEKFILIETPGKKMRNPIKDIAAFRSKFSTGYSAIRLRQLNDLTDKFEKERAEIDTAPIPLGLADKKIGEDAVTEFVGYQPQVVKVEVRKKMEMLK